MPEYVYTFADLQTWDVQVNVVKHLKINWKPLKIVEISDEHFLQFLHKFKVEISSFQFQTFIFKFSTAASSRDGRSAEKMELTNCQVWGGTFALRGSTNGEYPPENGEYLQMRRTMLDFAASISSTVVKLVCWTLASEFTVLISLSEPMIRFRLDSDDLVQATQFRWLDLNDSIWMLSIGRDREAIPKF